MGFSCGIVGLPNVGKSTLFNALTKMSVASSNYPFCTIDPNVGIVNVPDARLDRLAELSQSKVKTPTTVQFVDIAGLVKGASRGEGLGNQFLANIRNVDAVVQVVRLFEDPDVTHIGDVDPVRDLEIVNMELALKDMETVDGILAKKDKPSRGSGDKAAAAETEVLKKIREGLSAGTLVRNMGLSEDERKIPRAYQLLTEKEILIVGNVSEGEVGTYEQNPRYRDLKAKADELQCDLLVLSARIEREIAELDEREARDYLRDLGLETSGLERLIVEGYKLLGLITFFTTGEKETRAWTIHNGAKAPEAAGTIHSDMERGFIRAEVVAYDDFVREGSYPSARDKGLLRQEGRDYTVRDGDVLLFRFSV